MYLTIIVFHIYRFPDSDVTLLFYVLHQLPMNLQYIKARLFYQPCLLQCGLYHNCH